MRNMAEGAAHSMFNAVGNTFDKIGASIKLDEIKNDKNNRTGLLNGVFYAVLNLHMALIDLVHMSTRIRLDDMPTQDSKEVAKRLFTNIENNIIPDDKKAETYIRIISLNPYNYNLYISMMDKYGDENGQISALSKYFSISIDDKKGSMAMEYIKNNCGETEEDAMAAKEKLIEYCASLGLEVTDDLECMKFINEKLEKFDLKYRTVDGIVCETRQDADLAKKELPEIKDFIAQLKKPSLDDTLDYEEELLKKKQEYIDTFHSVLKDKYLKTIDGYLHDFDIFFCSMGIFKSGTRKEAAAAKAVKKAKGMKINSEEDYENACTQIREFLPHIGITEEEAAEAFTILETKKENIGKKGFFASLFGK